MGASYILLPHLGFGLYATSLRQDVNFQLLSYIGVIKGMYNLFFSETFFFFPITSVPIFF